MATDQKTVRAIFSINTGRSGSGYLAKIFGATKNCVSHHEAGPTGFGVPLRAFIQGNPSMMREVARSKAKAIETAANKGLVYVDTTHCFIKGFGWPLLEMVNPASIGIVILRRDKSQIGDSLFRIRMVPLNKVGPKFMLTPNLKNPFITPPSFFGFPAGIGYQLARATSICLRISRRALNLLGARIERTEPFPKYQRAVIDWYIEETSALEREFRTRYPECRYFEIDVNEANDLKKVQRMCEFFGIKPGEAQVEIVGTPTNLKLD